MESAARSTRNIAIIAHGGAGKTTLAGAVLFNAGAVKDPGSVDQGTSILDFEPEERKRRISISSTLYSCERAGARVNIIDTPGYSNFLSETRDALRAADGAVVMLSAISGVKAETEKIWSYAASLPAVAFVNKMDRERADFLRAVDDMERVLGVKGVAMQMPLGAGAGFKGVIDLISMKAFVYGAQFSGAYEVKGVPLELLKEARAMRDHLVESVAETDDALTGKYLSEGALSEGELMEAAYKAVLSKKFVPVYAGSALKNIGVAQLMDAADAMLAPPRAGGSAPEAVTGKNPATGEPEEREQVGTSPFSALVFKTVLDPYTGKLSIFRVYSGVLRPEATVLNANQGVKEKISHLYLMEGKSVKEVSFAAAGDIVAASKLRQTHTGDTLCDAAHPVIFDGFVRPAPVLSYAINPLTKADEDKAPSAIAKLMEEDPALGFRHDDETKEFILSGAGQVHLEASLEKLKRKYACEVALKAPRIPYRETIQTSVKAQGKYKKQSGGHGQYGDVWLELSPLARGAGFEFVNAVTGGAVPRQFIPAVEKGVREAMHAGVLAGFPVTDVRVTLYDGSHHSVDSSEISFKIAASMGFKEGMKQAHPVLLEPVMSMEVDVPEACLGAVMGDLNARRGKILGATAKAGSHSVKALVPMSGVISYATDLKGLTGDRGIFSMEFSHYEEVPAYLSKKIIEGAKTGAKEG